MVADFNADGKPDLAVADEFNVTVLLNISAGVQLTSSTSLTSSRNPAELHQRVAFTAKVTTTSQGTPTGSVTFSDNGHALANVSVANGRAKFSTSSLDAGIHLITASYSGDQTFQSSTSPELKQVIRVVTRTRLASLKIHPGADICNLHRHSRCKLRRDCHWQDHVPGPHHNTGNRRVEWRAGDFTTSTLRRGLSYDQGGLWWRYRLSTTAASG